MSEQHCVSITMDEGTTEEKSVKVYINQAADAMCYRCKYRGQNIGTHHSNCTNTYALNSWNPHGVNNGWAFWPFDFDPIWLTWCTGYESQKKVETTPEPHPATPP